ncbi:MAG: hypothetical protein KDH18_25210, partial [Rhodoferax sp.]|nr:hypothetical protein [Rhodoferax sp.]
MRDVQRGRAIFADQRLEQDQHLDLRRHVQRRRGFVQHQDVRAAGHGHGSHGALQLATRGLVRIPVAEGLVVGQVERLEQLARPGLGLLPRHDAVDGRRLADLVHDGVGRVEGRGCGLGHVGDALATHVAPAGGVEFADVDAVDLHRTAGDVHAGAGIRHRRQADGGFAGPALAD